MTKSYNDPVKQLARIKLREFVARHVIAYKNPKKVYVACLPGAEQEGEEALEVKEVYDPLGIPMANIVGIERETKIAARLRAANLGIQVEEESVLDYFIKTPRKFDVVSLDYKGHQTIEETITLEAIASKQIIGERGIVATTYKEGRESPILQLHMAYRCLTGYDNYKSLTSDLPPHEEILRAIEMKRRAAEDTDLDKARNGITIEVINAMSGGTIGRPVCKHPYSSENDSNQERLVRELIKDYLRELPNYLALQYGERLAQNKTLLRLMQEGAEYEAKRAFARWKQRGLIKKLSEWLPEKEAYLLATGMAIDAQKGYVLKNLERYEYTSNKRSKMLVDFLFFTQLPLDIRGALSDSVKFYSSSGPAGWDDFLFFNPRQMSLGRLSRNLARIIDFFDRQSITSLQPRAVLSVDALKQLEAITDKKEASGLNDSGPELSDKIKEEVREYIQAGFQPDEVWDAFKQHFSSRRQFGATIAWVKIKAQKGDIKQIKND